MDATQRPTNEQQRDHLTRPTGPHRGPLRTAGPSFVCALLALTALIASAQTSSARIALTPAGHAVSFQPPTSATSGLSPARHSLRPFAHTAAGALCSPGSPPCLSYGNGPILRTAEFTPLFWDPENRFAENPDQEFKPEVDRFFTDLESDNGLNSNFYSVLSQYYDTLGGRTSYVTYKATAGTPQTDTDPYPTAAPDACTDPLEESRPCVTDEGLQHELSAFIHSQGLPVGLGHEYVVYFPQGTDTCFGPEGNSNEDPCSGTYYCAYHSSMEIDGTVVQYTNEAENADPAYSGGCNPQQAGNAQATINTTSHELSESVADPEPASGWYDSHETPGGFEWGEVGDICAWSFTQGDQPGGFDISAGASNQTINGQSYLLQDEWDNANDTCSVSADAAGDLPPVAAFTVSPSATAPTEELLTFNGSSSSAQSDRQIVHYSWSFGDGATSSGTQSEATHTYPPTGPSKTSEYQVTLTVLDNTGQESSTKKTVTITDRPPTASFTPPSTAVAGAQVPFAGAGSTDPDGQVSAYDWNWGDGTPDGSGANPDHAFAIAGTYTVTLTVTDNSGVTSSVAHTLTVTPAPTPAPSETQTTSTPSPTPAGQGVLGVSILSKPTTTSKPKVVKHKHKKKKKKKKKPAKPKRHSQRTKKRTNSTTHG